MIIDLLSIHYDNIHEIPYLNGGDDVSSSYISDLEQLKEQINDSTKYLDTGNVQSSLKQYYNKGYHSLLDLEHLEDYIADALLKREFQK